MASKKDKLVESAQKSIAKGQIGKAISEYEQIVALDPDDARHRQKLAELLVKANNKDAAIAEYEAISKQFASKHFYLKAIAVHKQIQKLDPDNINITLTLASLNEKQGLIGNALAEYNLAVTHYLKIGEVPEAITVIERMLAADPDNLNTRLKCAETYIVAKQPDKAYEEFSRLALLLGKRGDESAFGRVCERVRALVPDKPDFVLDILETQIGEGDVAGALAYLRELTDNDKTDLRGWKLLVDAYQGCGDNANRKLTLQKIIDLYPSELFAQESLIRLHLDEGDIEGALALLKGHEADFVGQNVLEPLEHLYASLREKAPGDLRVLEGLKRVYAAAGEKEKLGTVVAAMNTVAVSAKETPGPDTAVSRPIPVEPAPVEPVVPSQESSWEEEIDLSLLEEEGIDACQDAKAGGNAAAESVPEMPRRDNAHAGGQPEDFLASSVDLTEIEMEIEGPAITFAGWQQDAPQQDMLQQELPRHEAPHEEPLQVEPLPVEPRQDTPQTEPVEAEDDVSPAVPAMKRKKYDAAGQFSEFKKVVDNQLEKDDTETHYNLGIAYKEMCLFDDAINEFQTASMDPLRKVDCLTLQAICYRDKGDFAKAEEVFRNTLSLHGLTGGETASLSYELAFLYESIGRGEDALRHYRQVQAEHPGFRDAAEKIALLRGVNGSPDQDDTEPFELDAEEVE